MESEPQHIYHASPSCLSSTSVSPQCKQTSQEKQTGWSILCCLFHYKSYRVSDTKRGESLETDQGRCPFQTVRKDAVNANSSLHSESDQALDRLMGKGLMKARRQRGHSSSGAHTAEALLCSGLGVTLFPRHGTRRGVVQTSGAAPAWPLCPSHAPSVASSFLPCAVRAVVLYLKATLRELCICAWTRRRKRSDWIYRGLPVWAGVRPEQGSQGLVPGPWAKGEARVLGREPLPAVHTGKVKRFLPFSLSLKTISNPVDNWLALTVEELAES